MRTMNVCRSLRRALVPFMLSGLASVAWADPPEGYPFLTYDEGIRLAQQQNKKVFLYFGRYGCGWCDKTNQETFSDAALKKLYIDRYVLVYVDAESGERLTLPSGERITEMELGSRLKVFATPVFVYLEPDGTPILRAPGYKTVDEFMDFDRYVSEGHYKQKSLSEFLDASS